MNPLAMDLNWSLLLITFLMSFPRVLKRMMGQKVLGESYEALLGLGITMVMDCLKWIGQNARSIHALAIRTMLAKHLSFAIIALRVC